MKRVALRAGDLSLLVEVTGAGAPVVWVAGLGDDHTSWSGPIQRLEDAFTCIAFDNRGCGGSDTPSGPYTVAEMAEDAHLLIDELGLGRVAAVGSSMGGAICQEWAAAHPEDLSALVITNSWAATDAYTSLLFDHWIALANAGGARRLAESLVLFSLSAEFLDGSGAEPYLAPIDNLAGFSAAAAACRGHDARGRLGALTVPTLVIAGVHDALTRPGLSRQLAELIPNARLELIEAGHMVFWERPDEFSTKVRGFLTP